MEEKVEIVNYLTGKFLIVMIFVFVTTFATTGFANGFKIDAGNGTFINANILYAASKIDSDRFSISYDGISNNKRMTSQSKRNLSLLDSEKLSELKFEPALNDTVSFRVAQRLKSAADYVLKYIKIGSFLSDNSDLMHLTENKVKTDTPKIEKLDFNLSVAIGHNDDKIINMEAVNLESCWNNTFINAVYHFQKNEIEFGLSNSYINNSLLDGMKLEFQANPTAKSGMILLTKSL